MAKAEHVIPKRTTLAALLRLLRKVNNLRVSGGVEMTNTPELLSLHVPTHAAPAVAPARVSPIRYGKLKTVWAAAGTTVTLTPVIGPASTTAVTGAADVTCKVLGDLTTAQAAPLMASVNDILPFVYADPAADPPTGYLVNPPVKTGTFNVVLSQTGGSNGSASAAATWTYSATLTVGGSSVTLGTGLSPTWPREYGTRVAATAGLGEYTGTAFTLLVAFEKPGTGTCA